MYSAILVKRSLGRPEGQTPKDPNIPNGLWRRNLLRGQPVLQQMRRGTHGRVSVLPEHQIIMYFFSVCFCMSQTMFWCWITQEGITETTPVCCTVQMGSAWPFSRCPTFVCMKGWKPWTFMSHFLAISLRTRELPHLSAGTGTSSGGAPCCLCCLFLRDLGRLTGACPWLLFCSAG